MKKKNKSSKKASDSNGLTPAMKQYQHFKTQYPDAILFFRMGDFYEMFYEDARLAARILQITLTSRDNKTPMAGVPYHVADTYIARLITAGYKVAVCEQVEDAKQAKGVVKRDVLRVITPGIVLDGANLEAKENNYLLGIYRHQDVYGLALVDFSTGEFRVTEIETPQSVEDEIDRIEPREMVLPRSLRDDPLLDSIIKGKGVLLTPMEDHYFDYDRAYRILADQFKVHSLSGFGCDSFPLAIQAAGAVLDYLMETQKSSIAHLTRISVYNPHNFMIIDEATTRNLELFQSILEHDKASSLLGIIDKTITPMGGRLQRQWLRYPLKDIVEINDRLEAVEGLHDNRETRENLRNILSEISDMERLNGKVSMGTTNPRDLIALKQSLVQVPLLKNELSIFTFGFLEIIEKSLQPLPDIVDLIERAIVPNPPPQMRDGGYMREGYNEELDELLELTRKGKTWIAELEAKEKERAAIPTLKIKYNKVFGYFIEVSNAHKDKVPEDYIRKQTLTNAERFITADLKEYEAKVLNAEERRVRLEQELFQQVRLQVADAGGRLMATAGACANLDVLSGLAELAENNGYVKPKMTDYGEIEIVDGRHPVIEVLNPQERFVPNDLSMDGDETRLLIITGPNMAGKSTYLRQVALIVLMAHIGSFVPAESATVPLTDRIFTRVGASDNLVRGQSTFMVEMSETANILNNATGKSLVILDEIGRGTSTFDGMSIAWAVAEYLLEEKNVGAKTLFATHYHELTELSLVKEGVKNYNVAVREWQDQIIFLRKIVEGAVSRSYGIQVAKLAGLPHAVISRSKEILENLEKDEFNEAGKPRRARSRNEKDGDPPEHQLSLFAPRESKVEKEIKEINLENTTPMDALKILMEWQETLKNK